MGAACAENGGAGDPAGEVIGSVRQCGPVRIGPALEGDGQVSRARRRLHGLAQIGAHHASERVALRPHARQRLRRRAAGTGSWCGRAAGFKQGRRRRRRHGDSPCDTCAAPGKLAQNGSDIGQIVVQRPRLGQQALARLRPGAAALFFQTRYEHTSVVLTGPRQNGLGCAGSLFARALVGEFQRGERGPRLGEPAFKIRAMFGRQTCPNRAFQRADLDAPIRPRPREAALAQRGQRVGQTAPVRFVGLGGKAGAPLHQAALLLGEQFLPEPFTRACVLGAQARSQRVTFGPAHAAEPGERRVGGPRPRRRQHQGRQNARRAGSSTGGSNKNAVRRHCCCPLPLPGFQPAHRSVEAGDIGAQRVAGGQTIQRNKNTRRLLARRRNTRTVPQSRRYLPGRTVCAAGGRNRGTAAQRGDESENGSGPRAVAGRSFCVPLTC